LEQHLLNGTTPTILILPSLLTLNARVNFLMTSTTTVYNEFIPSRMSQRRNRRVLFCASFYGVPPQQKSTQESSIKAMPPAKLIDTA
jgi:hypothetical protein